MSHQPHDDDQPAVEPFPSKHGRGSNRAVNKGKLKAKLNTTTASRRYRKRRR